ncbi:hypothetical protein JMM81_15720 [Bacillus sp. V3B]|uniref:hypothetical protein n=1 Tax=Bacillus sp. V3B TaxID=2804915 RepID=UPI00210DF8C6|nr:hypothetical protein [Bacillus sp. V3B]MCQ6276365.1 hypothetical protein [Bacillus sp. V3B]
MHKILRYTFLWFCIVTAAASILGGFFLLDIPLYIKLISIGLLAFFAYDAITEHKKRKNDEVLDS